MTALAVAYGYRFAGLPGTVISLTALVLPALVLTAVYGPLHRQAWLPELLPVTILPAALAFIVVAGVRLGQSVLADRFAGVQRKRRKQAALLGRAEPHRPRRPQQLQRSQDPGRRSTRPHAGSLRSRRTRRGS
jgi:hypothetical protein